MSSKNLQGQNMKLIYFLMGLTISGLSIAEENSKKILDDLGGIDCNKELEIKDLSYSESYRKNKLVNNLAVLSALRYLSGQDSRFGDYYNALQKNKNYNGMPYSDEMEHLKARVADGVEKEYLYQYSKHLGREFNESAYESEFIYLKNPSACRLRDIAAGYSDSSLPEIKEIVDQAKNVSRESQVGYFYVKINSCKVDAGKELGKSGFDIREWPDSRFVTLDVSFKNLDSESRLPFAGSLSINHLGRELTYDSSEFVSRRGYGIYFQPINPLLSMNTKLVYRIPKEVKGEIYWTPGRNPEDKKLWCGFSI